MAFNFEQFAACPSTRSPPTDETDDTSMATPQAGVFTPDIEDETKEIIVRFDFEPKTAEEATKVTIVHTHLLSRMQEAFSDNCLFFDNKGGQLSSIDPIHWTPVKHQNHFHIHVSQRSNNRRSKYMIIHRIRTSQSMSTIRNYNTVNSLLKEHNCYMKTHAWAETIWDVSQAGFLIGIDPQYYTPESATKLISNLMAKKGHSKCPPL